MLQRMRMCHLSHVMLVLLLSIAGCRPGKQEPAAPGSAPPPYSPGPPLPKVALRGNLLANPGFEEGREPWFIVRTENWVGFDVGEGTAHGGSRAARLSVRAGELSPPTQIWGVSQYVNPDRFPQKLEGWYRVQYWEQGDHRQYIQAVLMVWGRVPERDFQNYQVRYILAGVDEQPYSMANARYVFLGRGRPVVGGWIHFAANPAEDFSRLWKQVPSEYAKIQVFFEARFDDRSDALDRAEADVYFDDLYLGE